MFLQLFVQAYLQHAREIDQDEPSQGAVAQLSSSAAEIVMAAYSVRWPDKTAATPARPPHVPPPRSRPPLSGFAAFPLPVDPESPRVARRLVRGTLQNWGLHTLVDDVTVTVSELVTNALRHGVGDEASPLAETAPSSSPLATQPVLVGLVRRSELLLCAVFDPGQGVPVVGPDGAAGLPGVAGCHATLGDVAEVRADAPAGGDGARAALDALDALEAALVGGFAESGRGLQVVQAVSRAWGWTAPDRSGKAVWAVFATSPEAVAWPAADRPYRSVRVVPPAEGPGGDWDPVTRLLLLMDLLREASPPGSDAADEGAGPRA